MPLTPPPDYKQVYLVFVVGLSVALGCYILTRSTLPHVGDNLHSLPHGGTYADGTKRIIYHRPSGPLQSHGNNFIPLGLVLLLIFLIYVSGTNRHRRVNCTCYVCVPPAN
uniref:Triple gene block protein 2 n=1 Tax=Yam virus X TaxID=1503864 RepID=A0A0B4VMI6_9VIRU|nr:triple gene block protein 2 [Yam virus X]AJD23378.1 triple gene block protein 2 [Yam virus X]AJD23383.1 triple gene block protein 2 [Yam virus X]AJD23388.1 triple gene block protein 2 [Yam virus X]